MLVIAGFVKAAPSGDLDQVNGPQEKARRPLDRKSAGFQSSLRRGKESLLWPLCLQWSGEGFPFCGWNRLCLTRGANFTGHMSWL